MIDKYVLAIICAITGYIVFFDSFLKKKNGLFLRKGNLKRYIFQSG